MGDLQRYGVDGYDGTMLEYEDGEYVLYEDYNKALAGMTEEKERCRKLAVEYSLQADSYKQSLDLCQNMKLAREFEELLGTTSMPEAVKRVEWLYDTIAGINESTHKILIDFAEQAGVIANE